MIVRTKDIFLLQRNSSSWKTEETLTEILREPEKLLKVFFLKSGELDKEKHRCFPPKVHFLSVGAAKRTE